MAWNRILPNYQLPLIKAIISLHTFEHTTWSKTTSSQTGETRETRETRSNQNPSEKSVHQAAKLSGPVRPRSGPGFVHVSPAFLIFENVETWLLPAVLEIGHQVPASCHILGERRKYSRRRRRVEKCKHELCFANEHMVCLREYVLLRGNA